MDYKNLFFLVIWLKSNLSIGRVKKCPKLLVIYARCVPGSAVVFSSETGDELLVYLLLAILVGT